MAKDEQHGREGEITAVTHGVEVSVDADAPMPEVEPGHKGHELNPGPIFDPNAARREAEGRGPGLQDSEIMAPAHWQQATPVAQRPAQIEAQIAALEHERDGYAQTGDDRKGEVDAEIKRLQGELRQSEGERPAQPAAATPAQPVERKG